MKKLNEVLLLEKMEGMTERERCEYFIVLNENRLILEKVEAAAKSKLNRDRLPYISKKLGKIIILVDKPIKIQNIYLIKLAFRKFRKEENLKIEFSDLISVRKSKFAEKTKKKALIKKFNTMIDSNTSIDGYTTCIKVNKC